VFIDGDDLHSASNIAKMSAGIPLDDSDREPWLRVIRQTAQETVAEQIRTNATRPGIVVACSALKKYYREILRGSGVANPPSQPLSTYFVFIEGSREIILDRMQKRIEHFMKPEMLDSQLDTLEDPRGEEGVLVVSAEDSTEDQIKYAVGELNQILQEEL
jgi:gluconokinase